MEINRPDCAKSRLECARCSPITSCTCILIKATVRRWLAQKDPEKSREQSASVARRAVAASDSGDKPRARPTYITLPHPSFNSPPGTGRRRSASQWQGSDVVEHVDMGQCAMSGPGAPESASLESRHRVIDGQILSTSWRIFPFPYLIHLRDVMPSVRASRGGPCHLDPLSPRPQSSQGGPN